MAQPKVSVYILNHNYAAYLAQAIDSVQAQTLKDIEIIIIDDGSSDDSRCIIERYRSNKDVTIVYQNNRGITASNNIALRLAHGQYIMRLDADDYLDPHTLEVLAGHLDRNPKINLVFPDYWLVDEAGNPKEVVRRHDFTQVTMLDQPAHGACTLFRRELFLQLGGYDESFCRQDGYVLWLKMARNGEVGNVNLPLFYYRQHGPSLSSNETKILEVRSDILRKFAGERPPFGNTLGIIPIRNSKKAGDIPALRPLAGRPLIDWSIDAALESVCLSHVMVTTPCPEIIAHLQKREDPRVILHSRAANLAFANSAIESTVQEAVKHYQQSYSVPEVLAVLYIEAPFRTGRTIDSAIDSLQLYGVDSLVTVRPEHDIIYRHTGHGLEAVRATRQLRLEREELYREAGRTYVTRYQAFQNSQQLLSGRLGHAVVTPRCAYHLRKESDWLFAEYMASLFDNVPNLPARGEIDAIHKVL